MSIGIGIYDKLWAFRSFPEVYNDIDVFELQEQSLIILCNISIYMITLCHFLSTLEICYDINNFKL